MKTVRLVAVALLVLSVSACTSAPPRPVRSEFEDVPVPRGLTYQPEQSTIIESPTVKAARLVYRGRIEVDSLALALRTTLEQNGWRHVSTTSAAGHGTTQVYDKGGASLQVQVWEGWWWTYVEMNASRATPWQSQPTPGQPALGQPALGQPPTAQPTPR